jgi:hypothetical protein
MAASHYLNVESLSHYLNVESLSHYLNVESLSHHLDLESLSHYLNVESLTSSRCGKALSCLIDACHSSTHLSTIIWSNLARVTKQIEKETQKREMYNKHKPKKKKNQVAEIRHSRRDLSLSI